MTAPSTTADGSGATLEVSDLVKHYPAGRRGGVAAAAVNDLSFTVTAGQLFTLLGPSGCGKTTTLRCIAGLEVPDRGRITVGGVPLYSSATGVNLSANRRGLGMVFQSYAIWPHMSVAQNVAYPLTVGSRARRPSRAEVTHRVEQVLAVVELDALAGRAATDLSGGQQQRLALARALVARPPLLLLDEPLSNLDARLRERMRMELKRLQTTLGITTVVVTHDQSEALATSDRIAVLRDGALEQVGSPRDLYERPQTSFVADFIGGANLLAGRVSRDAGVIDVPTLATAVRVSDVNHQPTGGAVMVAIRPESLRLTGSGDEVSDGTNQWTGTVLAQGYLGDVVDLLVRVGELELRVRATPADRVDAGATVHLRVDPAACRVLAA